MEKYQMNRPGCRPYNNTCGMTRPQTPVHTGMANRGCGMADRNCNMPDRGCNMPDRNCNMPDRGCSMPDRECNMPDRGCNMPDRGCNMPDCGCNIPDRGCNCGAQPKTYCSCHMPGAASPNAEMFSHLKHLPLAMAYVPCQEFKTTFDLCYALNVGTIFPELCKPFCGKRGGCR